MKAVSPPADGVLTGILTTGAVEEFDAGTNGPQIMAHLEQSAKGLQLERLLNLAPDALTKEIALTEDLMELFIKYQIPSDLLSFDGDAGASASARLAAVKAHTSAVKAMIDGRWWRMPAT